ncbi:hypothetical protein HZB60_05185 [candidate division KSB1 bacterium]|nr:hypothetical protein [candidate division KSB1 bacterium]
MPRSQQRILGLVLAAALVVTSVSDAAEKRPGASAFLQSLIIPGWGQYSLGQKNSALLFIGSELSLIGGILALKSYSASSKDDYIAMARSYARVEGEHGHDFYVDLGNWLNVDQYNEQRLRDREYEAMYTNRSDRWQWDSDEHRGEFKKVRIRSDLAKNNVVYLAGALVVNHVVSALHAGRTSALREKHLSGGTSPLEFDAVPTGALDGIAMRARLKF